MSNLQTDEKWSENVIIVDGEYIDSVTFNLIVNFERMIGRHIPNADMARWLDCIALDGGIKEGEHENQVIFLHLPENDTLTNFAPSSYDNDLDGKAFKDNLGEFLISSYKVEKIVSKEDFLIDILRTASNHKDVKRIMVVANTDNHNVVDMIRHALKDADDEKRITVFAMQPLPGGNFRQEILGYSLMNALGIKADEINSRM